MYKYKNWTNYSHKNSRIILGICLLMIFCLFQKTTVNAATLKVRYGGKNYNYTSAQASATLDGSSINLKGTPGVLINDTCMLSASDVFKKGLGVSYQYDKSSKQIVITQNDITIEMKLNSKKAYINGNEVTCDVAPTKIKFVAARKTKLFLPARFVAEALGYSYNWNSTTKTSEMKQPFVINYDGSWKVYKGIQGKVTFEQEDIDLSGMPSIILDNTPLLRASLVFKTKLGADYTYDKESNTVTISQNDTTIEMTIDSNIAVVNGESKTMGTAARVIYNKATQKNYVMVPGRFVATNLGYEYSWNSGLKTSSIKTGEKTYFSQVFSESSDGQASLIAMEATCTNKKDILTLTGNTPLDILITEVDSLNLQLTISNVDANIMDITQVLSDSYYLKGVWLSSDNNVIVININKEEECNYYTVNTGNEFKLILCENANVDIDKSGFQLKFALPANVKFDSITTEDFYYENKFVIHLVGDYSSYFDQNPIQYNDAIVKDVNVDTTNEGDTEIAVTTCSLKGFKLNNCGDYIGVNIANPSSIYDKIIVLDAGHGGKDNGASSRGTKEKDLNYTIIYKLAKDYFNSPDSTIKAYWTRNDDTFIPLDDRAAFASEIGADVFVSLHMNSATSKASGLEVYYSKDNSSQMGNLTSRAMANLFYRHLIDDLDMDERNVKSAGFVVVKKNTVPSILIELGFLSNKEDYSKLTDPDFQDFAAHSIYNSAVALFEEYPTGR
ncbi:MAG: N-acetylmuramoyl-L-alanine amidase [Velocimicrobium sp.]